MAVYSKEMHQTSQEILDFADLVFSLSSGSTDFEAILPKAYSQARQHIVTHHVMREKGAIQALVDVYPLTLAAGDLSPEVRLYRNSQCTSESQKQGLYD